MKRILMLLAVLAAAAVVPVFAEGAGADTTKTLIGKLGDSKHSLLDGIAQAEKDNGPAISAKFEIKNGKLLLSVYTAKDGLDKDAEHNTLMELLGDATSSRWQPEAEVFADKAHIARSAMQLTLMQLTKLSLSDIVKKAAAAQKGTVYSAIPAMQGGNPVVNVQVATPDGKSIALCLDAQTGDVAK